MLIGVEEVILYIKGFESGLHKKVTGIERNFQELVCKARFEEAKWKETNLGWTIDTTLEVPMNGMNGHTGDDLWLLGRDRDRGSVLPPFKGAKEDAKEDSFEEWIDRLEEMGELRKLLYKAYPPTYHGTPEAELLKKRSVLSNQSVVEGNFEDLVCKAHLKRQSGRRQTLG
uniref:Uncharacterized protein n=1 Tax=Amphimedon queenslandica TaxID=400682 RepID=A0A1X7SMN2_AMPQE